MRLASAAVLLLAATACSNTIPEVDGWGPGEHQGEAGARFTGDLYGVQFDDTAWVDRWSDDHYTSMMVTTSGNDPLGMLILDGDRNYDSLFGQLGTHTWGPEDGVFAQLCGGDEEEGEWYDEPADETEITVTEDEDGDRTVEIVARVRGTDRWQSATFTVPTEAAE